MVPQDRNVGANRKNFDKSEKKCYIFTQSGSGMCPQLLALDKVYGSSEKGRNSDGRCSKYCKACQKPFHKIWTWEHHRAILKDFDAEEWIKEVWVRENDGAATTSSSEDETCGDERS